MRAVLRRIVCCRRTDVRKTKYFVIAAAAAVLCLVLLLLVLSGSIFPWLISGWHQEPQLVPREQLSEGERPRGSVHRKHFRDRKHAQGRSDREHDLADHAGGRPTVQAEAAKRNRDGDIALAEALDRHAKLQKDIRSGQLPFAAVIYECTEDRVCGGVTDRFEGILVMYIWAVITRRALLIHYCKPGPLSRFYAPNKVDWTLTELGHAAWSALRNAPHVNVGRHHDDNMACDVLVGKLEAVGSQGSVRVTTNHAKSCVRRLLSRHLGIGAFNNHHLMARLFHYVFKPTMLLQQALKVFRHQKGWSPANAVCLHIRYGGFPVNNANRERVRYPELDGFWQCAHHVGRLLQAKRFPISSWVVVSDTDMAVKQAKQALGTHAGNVFGTMAFGPAMHVDKLEELYADRMPSPRSLGQCAGFRGFDGEVRVFLDHYLLSECRVLIGSRKSGFSVSAAALHTGSKSRLFLVAQPSGNVSSAHSSNTPCKEYTSGGMW